MKNWQVRLNRVIAIDVTNTASTRRRRLQYALALVDLEINVTLESRHRHRGQFSDEKLGRFSVRTSRRKSHTRSLGHHRYGQFSNVYSSCPYV